MARRAAVKSEITDTLRAFYCALCEKQFQNVAQYDEHTNSYAHHHRARLRDMQVNARPVLQEDIEKRKEKERKREEKELRKLAKGAGIKMAKPSAVVNPAVPVLAPVATAETPSVIETKMGGFKKAGWASIKSNSEPVETSGRRAAWSAPGSATPSSSRPPSPPSLAPPPPPSDPIPIPAPPSSSSHLYNAPSFRAGGWSTLDTGSSNLLPPEPSAVAALPSPPSLPTPPVNESHPPLQPQSLPGPGFVKSGWASIASQPIRDSPLQSNTASVAAPLPRPPATPPPQESKSGWQQWKQSKNFKRK